MSFMLSVIYAESHFAECHDAERRGSEVYAPPAFYKKVLNTSKKGLHRVNENFFKDVNLKNTSSCRNGQAWFSKLIL
jgi:hypothetical protein